MSERYYIKTSEGSELLPIANGSFVRDGLSEFYNTGQVYISFYGSDGVTRVTPTAGTVEVFGSPDGEQFLAATAATIAASSVESADPASYTPPLIDGCCVSGKVTFSSIAGNGVTYAKVIFWRTV